MTEAIDELDPTVVEADGRGQSDVIVSIVVIVLCAGGSLYGYRVGWAPAGYGIGGLITPRLVVWPFWVLLGHAGPGLAQTGHMC